MRNLSSCVKVALDFVSPENAHRCVLLTEQFAKLPRGHHLSEDKLQVKTMLLHAMDHISKALLADGTEALPLPEASDAPPPRAAAAPSEAAAKPDAEAAAAPTTDQCHQCEVVMKDNEEEDAAADAPAASVAAGAEAPPVAEAEEDAPMAETAAAADEDAVMADV